MVTFSEGPREERKDKTKVDNRKRVERLTREALLAN